jgi:transglutaminase-like putative cysteine protease/tetratricopeptide (TPR) repeat protein
LPSIRPFLRCAAGAIALLFAVHGGAQTPAAPAAPAALAVTPAPAETPLKEVSVTAASFARGLPVPAWADLLPLPALPGGPRRALTLRLDDTHLLVGETPVTLVNIAQQANDASALGQIGQASIQFIPQYQRLVLHQVAIQRGEQVIDHTASAPVRFLQREAGLEQGIYSGVITASLLLPDVRVGDTLLLRYSIEGANPIFGGRYAQGVPWQRTVPVQTRRVTLNVPEARTVQWKWIGDGAASSIAPEVTTRGGLRRLRFEERDLAAVELEPMLPRGTVPLRWLQFTEFADWAEVARWADGLFAADAVLPPELAPLLQRLQRLPSRSDQASQALQWVQAEIRYYSVSLGESSHRPHTPAEVLRNRYGDCKDKSFLLMRILQSLGIPARAVLASLGAPQGPAKVLASPLAFDHVVVQTRIDGRDYYLDPTRLGQRGALDRMGQGLEEASVLVIDPRETSALATVRSPNRREIFRSELNEHFKLDAFGEDGELEMQQQFNGLAAETLRLGLARVDAQRLQRLLLTGLERRYPGIAVVGAPELRDDADQNRVTIVARFKVPKLATAVDGNWVMRFSPANMQGTIAAPPSPTRNFPLALPGFPLTVLYNAEMQWPASVGAVVEPGTVRLSNAGFNAEVMRSFRGNIARATLRFETSTPAVPAKDVPAMIADARAMERALGGAMVVARNQVKDGGFLGIGRKTLQDNLRTRAQASVERSSKAIAGGQLGGEDLAQALCLRADAQAELGNPAEAFKDAQEAVHQAPASAGAWLCQGNANWSRGEFAAAASDYGKALALGHSAADAYYRRGQARFLEGRFDAAAQDFAKAAADRTDANDKAYAQVWQALALQRLAQPLPAPLAAAGDPKGAWPRPLIAMVGGQVAPEQVLELIARKEGDDRELALAEGWFYIGEFQLGSNQPDKAREAFGKARAQGITRAAEHAAAGFELQRLGARP